MVRLCRQPPCHTRTTAQLTVAVTAVDPAADPAAAAIAAAVSVSHNAVRCCGPSLPTQGCDPGPSLALAWPWPGSLACTTAGLA